MAWLYFSECNLFLLLLLTILDIDTSLEITAALAITSDS